MIFVAGPIQNHDYSRIWWCVPFMKLLNLFWYVFRKVTISNQFLNRSWWNRASPWNSLCWGGGPKWGPPPNHWASRRGRRTTTTRRSRRTRIAMEWPPWLHNNGRPSPLSLVVTCVTSSRATTRRRRRSWFRTSRHRTRGERNRGRSLNFCLGLGNDDGNFQGFHGANGIENFQLRKMVLEHSNVSGWLNLTLFRSSPHFMWIGRVCPGRLSTFI